VKAYSFDKKDMLLYKKYKELDWSHIKNINLRNNNIAYADYLLKLTENCSRL
jgi:hypothetical protein